MLQWTTPAMLAGLGLLAMPIVAHLLNRKSSNTYFIPTIQFLIASAAPQHRFLKLRRWLLLLLRCLAVAAVVCMFARPVWWTGSNVSANKDSIGMAIVVDRSLSTTQKIGNANLFQSIRGSAIRSLDELTAGRDFGTVVLAGDSPESLQRKLVPNIPALKTQLKAVEPSFERADMPAAIAEASRQLNLFDGKRLLVIVSDMQRSNWDDVLNRAAGSFQLPPDTEVRFVQQKQRVTKNVALSNAQCDPPTPTIGQLVTLSVTTSNFSDQTKQIPVSLFLGNEKLSEHILRIDPGQASVGSFQIKCRQSTGYRFSIPSDSLEIDDSAFVAIAPGASTPITVISDDAKDAIGSSKFFLERAVRPFNSDRDRYQVQHVGTRSLKPGSLKGQQIVVVGYVSRWSEQAIDELLRFVRKGGSLVYLCGEGNVAGQLTKIEKQAKADCFPFSLTRLDRINDFERMLQIKSGKWRSRWLRAFDLPSQLALQEIRFDKVWRSGNLREGAEVLLQYSDDRPALGYSTFGEGTIVLANLSPSVEFSEFGKFGSFAALVQIVVGQLRDQDLTSDLLLVGAPVNFIHERNKRGDLAEPLVVIGPAGDEVKARVTETTDSVSCLVDHASKPGLYQLRSGDNVLQVVSVAIDPRESQLEYLEQVEVDSSFEESEVNSVAAGAFGLDLLDQGNPLWGWLAVGAILMMSSESFLLGWWKR